jgi:hypothetical protein
MENMRELQRKIKESELLIESSKDFTIEQEVPVVE